MFFLLVLILPFLYRFVLRDFYVPEGVLSSSVGDQYFIELDDYYGKTNPYVRRLQSWRRFYAFANEKKCFERLVHDPFPLSSRTSCLSVESKGWDVFLADLLSFLIYNLSFLTISCSDSAVFSHCQDFLLFTYDGKSRTCGGYSRSKCTLLGYSDR